METFLMPLNKLKTVATFFFISIYNSTVLIICVFPKKNHDAVSVNASLR